MALASTISFTTWRLLLDNFAVEAAQFGGDEIGLLQSVREVPGFLSFSVILILLVMGERTLALLSLALLGLGTALTGLFPSLAGLLVTTFVMSTGFHLFEAVNMSLSLQWLEKGEMPIVMGRIAALVSVAALVVYTLVWLARTTLGAGYAPLYVAAGVGTTLLVLMVRRGSRNLPAPASERTGFVLRQRYWLFYALTFMGGARRQIFVVFGGFMMVSLFGVDLSHMAGIYFGTLILTELMTNNAAAALAFPVAFGLAESYGISFMPFVMAVAYGASASFLTPYGYTTNLMVQNLGGYQFRDYTRAGLPVSLVYSALVLLLIPRIFPF